MPKLKQFQALGDATMWFVIGLDAGGTLWYGRRMEETPTRVTIARTPITEGGGLPTDAPRPPFGPRSMRGH